MLRSIEARVAILAIALAAFGTATSASAQITPTSSAAGVAATLTAGGTATVIKPVAHIGGNGGKLYSRHASVPMFSEALGVAVGGNLVGSMTIVTSGINTHASGSGGGGATTQTEADTAIASLELTIALTPPPGATQPPAAPLLSLTASDIAAQSTATRMLPSVSQQVGIASFGSLSLTGSMVGGQTLTFQGSAPANTVLYNDANMTVTLNQQDVSGTIACTPLCQFVPKKLDADAVLIEMFHKPLVGHATMSGRVYVAEDVAGLP